MVHEKKWETISEILRDINLTIKGFLIYQSLFNCDDIVACLCVSCGINKCALNRGNLFDLLSPWLFQVFHHLAPPFPPASHYRMTLWGAAETGLTARKLALSSFSVASAALRSWGLCVLKQVRWDSCFHNPPSPLLPPAATSTRCPASSHSSPLLPNESASRETAASLQVSLLSFAFK